MKTIKWNGKKFPVYRKWCYKNPFFSDGTRKKSAVKAIIIHNTGNVGDSALGNANYFNGGQANKQTYAGAHIIIDRAGTIFQCGRMKDICHSVGGLKWNNTNPKYYRIINNTNSLSIELCDIVDKEPSSKQLEALRAVIHWVKKSCKNADLIIRHYDVNGKPCPKRYVDEKEWKKLLKKIGGV